MNNSNVSKVLLDEELELLKKFDSSDTAFLTLNEYRTLEKANLVKSYLGGVDPFYHHVESGECELNDFGKRVRQYQHEKAEEQKRIAHAEERADKAHCLSKIALVLSVITPMLTLLVQQLFL